MKLPRRLHRIYARLMGYFWLPCPKCGEYFGGHELTGYEPAINSWVVCPRCAKGMVKK